MVCFLHHQVSHTLCSDILSNCLSKKPASVENTYTYLFSLGKSFVGGVCLILIHTYFPWFLASLTCSLVTCALSVILLNLFCRYLRSIAYREVTRLVYGYMGQKRIPLPSFAYSVICKAFPVQDDETLTGFELDD